MIISKHMEFLLGVEGVGSDQNVRALRRLYYDGVESHIRSLNSLGVNSDMYGTMLSSVFLNKLPPELRLIISRKISTSDTAMVEEKLVARERTFTTLTPSRRVHERHHSTTSFYTGTHSPSVAFVKRHTYLLIAPRYQVLVHGSKSSDHCFNCLRKGHLSRNCHSTGKCVKCRKRHHSSICEQDQSPSNPVSLNLTILHHHS